MQKIHKGGLMRDSLIKDSLKWNYVYIKTFIACPRIKIMSLIILHVDFCIGDGNDIFHFLKKNNNRWISRQLAVN